MLNKETTFLIQNMFPVTLPYIQEVYIDKNHTPIQIDHRVAKEIVRNAREVLAKVERGANIVFPDIKTIYGILTSSDSPNA